MALVGVTLAAGVITWAFSPIKFQADMGILLTFMFVWNMIGALVLIPALSLLPAADQSSCAKSARARHCASIATPYAIAASCNFAAERPANRALSANLFREAIS